MLGQLDHHKQKNEFGSLSYTASKINSKWINNLNIRIKNIKIFEESIGHESIHVFEFGNGFLDMTPKAWATQEKTANLDFITIKTFFATKDRVKKVKRQSTEWEKTFANYSSDLVSKIF